MSNPNNPLGRVTRKLYYEDYWLTAAEAKIVKITEDAIELDRTVAFPEGGGQEGDRGKIVTAEGVEIRFRDTKKRYGRPLFLPDFPTINVDSIIHHMVVTDDIHLLESLSPDQTVRVEIDVTRRACLTLSHTASHLVYLATQQIRPDAVADTRGCHIKEDSARFDFGVRQRFTPEHLERIGAIAEELVQRDLPIRVYPHPEEPEALYWECDGRTIPCGGTHLARTGPIGAIEVRRRNLGKSADRIVIAFPSPTIDQAPYHE